MAKKQFQQASELSEMKPVSAEQTETAVDKTEVKYIRLHEDLFIPGVGSMGKQINLEEAKFRKLKMWYTDSGLKWNYNNQFAGFIPSPNIVSGIFK